MTNQQRETFRQAWHRSDLRETPEQAGLVLIGYSDDRELAYLRDNDLKQVETWARRPYGFSGAGLFFDHDAWEFCSSRKEG